MPCRRRAAGQGDQVGLAPVVQLPAPVGLGTVLQNPRQPFFGKALLDPVHGAQGHIQGFSHLGRWPTVVALEENPGPGGDSGRAFPNPNQTLEFFPLLRRQPHCVLVPDQFTSEAFTGFLERQGGTVSMDGKGSYTDNLSIERLWRSLKYEEVYLKAYTDGREARSQIGEYFRFYNIQRPHQALEYRTPAEVYTSEREADMVHSQGTLTLTKVVKTAGPDLSLPSFLSN